MGSTITPRGTLSQKIHCHEMPSTTAPPTSGPSATARPEMPDQMPSAMPRRSAGNAAASSVRLSGSTSAAPAPWRARAATSSPQPELEDPAAPEAVPERGAGQQQHREAEGVGVDEPPELFDRRTEIAADA